MRFDVRWPDGRVERCWSPSLVVWEHLAPGTDYRVDAFATATGAALLEGAERVRKRFGFSCAAAAEQRDAIQETAARFAPDDLVRVLAMAPAPPGPS